MDAAEAKVRHNPAERNPHSDKVEYTYRIENLETRSGRIDQAKTARVTRARLSTIEQINQSEVFYETES
jgi:hypothetical protein